MAVIPYTLPSWVRTTSIEDYGGDVNKRDLLGVGPIDPQTDISASQIASLSSHLASIVRTSPLAIIGLDFDSPTWTITNCYTQWGTGLSFAPALTQSVSVNSGSFTLTFDTSYTDEYGQSQAIDIKNVVLSVGSSNLALGAPVSAQNTYVITAANVVKVVFDDLDGNGYTLTATIW